MNGAAKFANLHKLGSFYVLQQHAGEITWGIFRKLCLQPIFLSNLLDQFCQSADLEITSTIYATLKKSLISIIRGIFVPVRSASAAGNFVHPYSDYIGGLVPTPIRGEADNSGTNLAVVVRRPERCGTGLVHRVLFPGGRTKGMAKDQINETPNFIFA